MIMLTMSRVQQNQRDQRNRKAAIDRAIVNHKRDFVLCARELQRVFLIVAYKENSQHSGENIQPVNPQCVIVIPQHRRILRLG
jgi:hypothetical protein